MTSDDEQLKESRVLSEKILEREDQDNRYIVEKELARGGMGVIQVVHDQDLHRISAMKIIPPQLVDQEARCRAFVNEARVTAQLEHPNIVPIHEIGIYPETATPFYTMKLVEGEPLNLIIRKIAAGDPEYLERYHRAAMLDIFRKVCHAVAYAHSRGIIHRDLKPENVMVGQFGEVLLMDWGLAKRVGDDDDEESDGELLETDNFMMTQDGMIKGSPAYMSPEQAIADTLNIDTRTDIFLLGATLYHMFTYSPPYIAKDVIEMVTKAEICDHDTPTERNPEAKIPLALERVILKAMAPVRERRFATVLELIEEIDACIAGRRACGRKVFAAGEHLVSDGDESGETYVITNGSVQVYTKFDGKRIPVAKLARGEIVGEMASISHRTRSADVVALESTETLVITEEAINEELDKLPPWLSQIVISLVNRVQTMNMHVHPFQMDQRLLPIVNQVYLLFMTAESQVTEANVNFSFRNVIEEIYLNLGIETNQIATVLNSLVESGLCATNDVDEYLVPDLKTYGIFVEYCRYQLRNQGGVKEITGIHLTPEQESMFRSAVRRLRECANIDN